MTRYISKVTNKTLTKGRQYQILRKDQHGIFILNDEKLIEKFDKKQLKTYFEV